MASYTLDTHATVKQLENSGMESRQAEAVVAAISRSDADLATKQDLAPAGQGAMREHTGSM